MRRLALLVLATLPAASGRAAAPATLAQLADAVAREVGAPPAGRRSLMLAVEARGALGPTIETALSAALAAQGFAVTPRRGAGDAERAARAGGQDWLLRVRAGLVPGRREIAVVGELIPTWRSFFLQNRPDARPIPPRVVEARAPADTSTLLLEREAREPGAPFARIRTLARMPGRVLALAAGELDDAGRRGVVAVTEDAVTAFSPDGAPIAARAADGALAPLREPGASVAIGDFGGGRIALHRAGAARGEVLALRGDRLEAAGALEAAPLCAGEAGRLFGAFVPGTSVLEDLISPLVDPAARPRSARTLYGVAAAPRRGPIAFAVLGTDLRLELLGPELEAVEATATSTATAKQAPAPLTGAGFALADLDGDGTAELAASSPDPHAPERIRILAPLAAAPLLLESEPIDGAILAGAGFDLTGDGTDDAVLASVRGEGSAAFTVLLLVTADPAEAQ
jgi:hypothetical protein